MNWVGVNSWGYRFGFNGQEKDDEIKGMGNSIHFEFREYDSRLGRFMSIDPLSSNYPWQSPYAFAANNPIMFVDIKGLGPGDPPTSTKEDALAKLDDCSTQSIPQSSAFPNITPDQFISQLKDRVNNPDGLNQGKSDLCWAASQGNYMYTNNPVGMVDAMIDLYQTGTFNYNTGINTFSMSPENSVGQNTGGDNMANSGMNSIDQMFLLTMGSNFKGYMNLDRSFQPGDENKPMWAGANLAKAASAWNAFGYDVSVRGNDILWPALNKGGIITKAINSGDVVLFINKPVLEGAPGVFGINGVNGCGTHYVNLNSINSGALNYWDKKGNTTFQTSQMQLWYSVNGIITIQR
jgi:RHS repeat-associated protein